MTVPTKLRLDDQLCFSLYAASNAIIRSYRPLLAEIGLTYPQYLLMLVLWQDGERTVRELADRLKLSPSAVTPLVDRLEIAGLVRRQRDEQDRRVVHVGLTDQGSAVESEAAAVQYRVACDTGLGDGGITEMRESLHALADRLETTTANGARPAPVAHRRTDAVN
ncbi:MAG: MarR family winged helix-turn-helix transcriptional regulator [Pseudomonadota bacterium]